MDPMRTKYLGLKMKKKEDEGKVEDKTDIVPESQEVFPQNPKLQAELDSLDNEDRMRRNALMKRRMMLDKGNK